MALYAFALVPWIPQQFFDAAGDPLASGKVWSYAAGTSTPLATYTNANGSATHTNPIILDANGRPPSPIFVAPTGYKFVIQNSASVQQWTVDLIEDVGLVFASTFGTLLSAGAKNVVSGYQVLPTDRLITVNSTASPCIVNLCPAANYAGLLTIKNMGAFTCAITPAGADTLESTATAWTLAASAAPLYRSVMLLSDHVSAWFIIGGHGSGA